MNWKPLGENEFFVSGSKDAIVSIRDDGLVEILIKESTLDYPAQTRIRVWADGDAWEMSISQGYNISLDEGYATYPRLPDKDLLIFVWELLDEGNRKGFLPPLTELDDE